MRQLFLVFFLFGVGLPRFAWADLTDAVVRNAVESLSGVGAIFCHSLLRTTERSLPEPERAIQAKLDAALEHKLFLFYQRGGKFVFDAFNEDFLEAAPAKATLDFAPGQGFFITLSGGFKDPSQAQARELVSRDLQYWFDLEDIAGKISSMLNGPSLPVAKEELWKLYNTFGSETSARLHYELEERALSAEAAAGIRRTVTKLDSSYVPTAERKPNEPHRYEDLPLASTEHPFPELEALRFLLPSEAEARRSGLLVDERPFSETLAALNWNLFPPSIKYYLDHLVEKMMKIYQLAAHREAVQLREQFHFSIPVSQIENAKERLRGLFREYNLPNNTTQFSTANTPSMNTHLIGPLVLRRYVEVQFKWRADVEKGGHLDYLLREVYP